MNKSRNPLKVLMIEDSPADAELVLRELKKLSLPVEHQRVCGRGDLLSALDRFEPDIVLSDFSIPGFSGQEALRVVHDKAPQIPFLFVSGTIGEELAIEALRLGAMDYVLKDNLRRLAPAVERAVDSARQRNERHDIESALRESEERFRMIVESSGDWIWESDDELRITYSNSAVEHILGYRPEQVIGTVATEFMLPTDSDSVRECVPVLMDEQKGWESWRLRWRHRDGSVRVMESTATPRLDAAGRLVGYRGVDEDITERLQQENRIRRFVRIHAVLSGLGNAVMRARTREQLLQQICEVAVEEGDFEVACIGMPIGGERLDIVACHGKNPALVEVIRKLSQSTEAALQEDHFRPAVHALLEARNIIVHDFAKAKVPPELKKQMAAIGVSAHIALPIGSPPWGVLGLFSSTPQEFDKEEIALLERVTGEVDYAVDFIAKSERLEYLAYHDPVTGLPNRAGFHLQCDARFGQDRVAMGVIHLTIFNRMVDSRGREFGEQLLRIVAERMRQAFGMAVIVARPGEDVFLLAQRATGTVEHEVDRLDALLRAFEEVPCEIEGERIFARFACGLAIGPEHGTGETLERKAASALAEAHRRSVRVEPFTGELHAHAMRRIEVERNLHRAFEQDEFELFYQPKFDTRYQRLLGAEALMRWRHPQSGLISPADFIPVLEETGMIVAAGRWVMRTALETALAWRARGRAGLRIAVNVSARELRNLHFLDECRELLEPHANDQLLDIEVTESLLMEDIDHSIYLLKSLRDLGCRIAIDDFGTGYSSLNYLARLPADAIKIDQSFTAQLAHSPESMSLITNIITLAHSLSLKVIAEGVEEEEQVKLFRLLRCDELQGYLLGRPMPGEEFVQNVL